MSFLNYFLLVITWIHIIFNIAPIFGHWSLLSFEKFLSLFFYLLLYLSVWDINYNFRNREREKENWYVFKSFFNAVNMLNSSVLPKNGNFDVRRGNKNCAHKRVSQWPRRKRERPIKTVVFSISLWSPRSILGWLIVRHHIVRGGG